MLLRVDKLCLRAMIGSMLLDWPTTFFWCFVGTCVLTDPSLLTVIRLKA